MLAGPGENVYSCLLRRSAPSLIPRDPRVRGHAFREMGHVCELTEDPPATSSPLLIPCAPLLGYPNSHWPRPGTGPRARQSSRYARFVSLDPISGRKGKQNVFNLLRPGGSSEISISEVYNDENRQKHAGAARSRQN